MSNVKLERLSVTTWPGYPVPVPELPRYPEATLDGETIWIPNWNGKDHGEMAPAPPELYLRQARQVDTDDPHALLDFVRNVGGVPWILEDRDLWADEGKDRRADFADRRNRTYEEPQLVAGRGWGVHLDEVAYRLRILDILGRYAVAYRRGDYLAPVWREAFTYQGSNPFETEQDAWRWFGYHANHALQVFHVRIRVLTEAGDEISDQGATFLEAGVLQIANDLADQVDYLTCPNCSMVFARQVGESTHYSRRTGVTYCTPQCATAARVKAYRARKRAERSS
jgi:hypothetical protein